MTEPLDVILRRSEQHHRHLCPRQVLGARIGIEGARVLGIDIPRADKTVFAIAETDGCFLSGLMAATGFSVNKRTLRIEDYGKIAATFVAAATNSAVRISPQPDARDKAWQYADEGESRRYFAMKLGYQRMPAHELLKVEYVALNKSAVEIMSKPRVRALCDSCREEIINEREIIRDNLTLCKSCADGGYYTRLPECIDIHML